MLLPLGGMGPSAATVPWHLLPVHRCSRLLLSVVMPVPVPRHSPLPAPTACPLLCRHAPVLSPARGSVVPRDPVRRAVSGGAPRPGWGVSTPLLRGTEQLSAWPGCRGAQGWSCQARRWVPGPWRHRVSGAAGAAGAGVRAGPCAVARWGPTWARTAGCLVASGSPGCVSRAITEMAPISSDCWKPARKLSQRVQRVSHRGAGDHPPRMRHTGVVAWLPGRAQHRRSHTDGHWGCV